MAGFAPCGLGRAGRVRRALLIAQSDAEAGNRFAHLQTIADRAQRMRGGGKQVRAVGHPPHFAPGSRGGEAIASRQVSVRRGTSDRYSDARGAFGRHASPSVRQAPAPASGRSSMPVPAVTPAATASRGSSVTPSPPATICTSVCRLVAANRPGRHGRRPAGRTPPAPGRAGNDRPPATAAVPPRERRGRDSLLRRPAGVRAAALPEIRRARLARHPPRRSRKAMPAAIRPAGSPPAARPAARWCPRAGTAAAGERPCRSTGIRRGSRNGPTVGITPSRSGPLIGSARRIGRFRHRLQRRQCGAGTFHQFQPQRREHHVLAGAAIQDRGVELPFQRQDPGRERGLGHRAGQRGAAEMAAFGERGEDTAAAGGWAGRSSTGSIEVFCFIHPNSMAARVIWCRA